MEESKSRQILDIDTQAESEFIAMVRLAGVHEWLAKEASRPFGGVVSVKTVTEAVKDELAETDIDGWTNLAVKMVADHPARFGVIAASFERIATTSLRLARFYAAKAIWEASL